MIKKRNMENKNIKILKILEDIEKSP